MRCIDVNVDMGESTTLWPYQIEQDIALLEVVSSVNIATGYHAGDRKTMQQLVSLAISRNKAIGVHCSYPDTANFGRTPMPFSMPAIFDMVSKQIEILQQIVQIQGGQLHHVKPHGALYNTSAKEAAVASTIAEAIKSSNPSLKLYGLSGSESIKEAERLGIAVVSEVFADRTYQQDGNLTPRGNANATLTDIDHCLQQVLQMVHNQTVKTVQGNSIPIKADTICVHSDGRHALSFAKAIVETLALSGIDIKYPK